MTDDRLEQSQQGVATDGPPPVETSAEVAREHRGARRPEVREVRVVSADALGDARIAPVFERARVVRARVVERLEQMADHVDAATRHAATIVREAESEASAIRQAARDEGHAEGAAAWSSALAELERERSRMVEEAERDLLELALRLAGRIVGREVQMRPETAAEIVAETLQHVRGDRRITVEVSPADLDIVETYRADLSSILGGEPIVFQPNEAIERGGCVVVTSSQRIDAQLETQLEAMRRALVEGHDD
jgi:type III secretion protein L